MKRFSTVILTLSLIQEEQLSVPGERLYTLRGLSLLRKIGVRFTDWLDMTLTVLTGPLNSSPTNLHKKKHML